MIQARSIRVHHGDPIVSYDFQPLLSENQIELRDPPGDTEMGVKIWVVMWKRNTKEKKMTSALEERTKGGGARELWSYSKEEPGLGWRMRATIFSTSDFGVVGAIPTAWLESGSASSHCK